jgi:hypothetical protein
LVDFTASSAVLLVLEHSMKDSTTVFWRALAMAVCLPVTSKLASVRVCDFGLPSMSTHGESALAGVDTPSSSP